MNIATNGSRKCAICDEIYNGYKSGMYYLFSKQSGKEVGSRILYEDEQLIIMPSLGPVAKCHLLIVPKWHRCSYALLDKEVLYHANKVIRKVTRYVKENYGSCMVFEHGTLTEEMQGSMSCTHAHLHVVSCSKSLKPYLEKDGLIIRKMQEFVDLKKQCSRNKPYFFYAEDEDNMFIMDDIIQKSQYLRMKITDVLKNADNGDWKNKPRVEMVEEMVIKIREKGEFI